MSWKSVKQNCIADSTMESEYVAVFEATKKTVWPKKFLIDLEVVLVAQKPITLFYNNSRAIL